MEADEIGVVLARASEIHAKISDAIERAMKSEFLHSTSGKSLDSDHPSSPPAADKGDEYDSYEGYERGDEKATVVVGNVNAEARSLGSIRDALEILEEQLEALQAMQQHQRTEKDAALAELEESRHVLLQKLKNHRGREWEVIHEALAFAGEPVEERDDLLLPPYPRPIVDPASFAVEGQAPPFLSRAFSLRNSSVVKRLTLAKEGDGEEEDEEKYKRGNARQGVEDGEEEGYQEQGTSPQHGVEAEASINVAGGFMGGFTRKFGNVLIHATKAVLVVVSVAAFLAFTEHGHRQVERKARPGPVSVKPVLLLESHPKPPPSLKCPPGKKLIMQEEGYPKCVVKERFEVPFSREVKDPDVLYGRG